MKRCYLPIKSSLHTLLALVALLAIFKTKEIDAHLPRLVGDNSSQDPVSVETPEISQAFYGKLHGAPHFFKIKSDQNNLLLYVNILVPDVIGARTDFVVEVEQDGKKIRTLNGSWLPFYEKYAGDAYIRGPTFEKNVPKGTYVVRVSNPENRGNYILAIGNRERITPWDIIGIYRLLPSIKKDFFHTSPIMAFFNFFTLLIVSTIALIAGTVVLITLIKRRFSK